MSNFRCDSARKVFKDSFLSVKYSERVEKILLFSRENLQVITVLDRHQRIHAEEPLWQGKPPWEVAEVPQVPPLYWARLYSFSIFVEIVLVG